jgi:hypothetical protein
MAKYIVSRKMANTVIPNLINCLEPKSQYQELHKNVANNFNILYTLGVQGQIDKKLKLTSLPRTAQ